MQPASIRSEVSPRVSPHSGGCDDRSCATGASVSVAVAVCVTGWGGGTDANEGGGS
jgi:hypothetical protein